MFSCVCAFRQFSKCLRDLGESYYAYHSPYAACVCEYTLASTSIAHMRRSPKTSCKFGQWKTLGLWELLFIGAVKRTVEL